MIQFFGSIALFLFGIKLLGEGLESAASTSIRQGLQRLTRNRFTSFVMGFLLTLILQFSSATVILTVGLVNSGIISLIQAGAMILGANLGTTIKAQFFLADPGFIMPLSLIIGTAIYLFARERSKRQLSAIFLGMGILLAGLDFLQSSVLALSTGMDFEVLLQSMGGTWLAGLLAGLIITVMIQSSSGAMAVFITMAAHGVITVDLALPLIMGANIGTTSTSLIAAVGVRRAGRQAALMHLLFNVLGVLLIAPFGSQVTDLAGRLSNGTAAMQLANIHILFNLLVGLIMLPLLPWIGKLTDLLLPGRQHSVELAPSHLDRNFASSPDQAEEQARRLILKMGDYARENVQLAADAFLNRDPSLGKRLKHNEDYINYLVVQITSFLVKHSAGELSEPEQRRMTASHHIIAELEKIGDLADGIMALAEEETETGAEITQTAREEFNGMYNVVIEAVNLSLEALADSDAGRAGRVRELEDTILRMEQENRDRHIRRLNEGRCSPGTGILYMDAMSGLVRIVRHTVNIAEKIDNTADT